MQFAALHESRIGTTLNQSAPRWVVPSGSVASMGSIGHGCLCSCYGLAVFGVDRQLHLKRRTFAERRLHPNAAAMHFHNLLGDGEAKPRTAFRLGVRAVDLVELLEDAR